MHQVYPQDRNTNTLNKLLDSGDKLYSDLSAIAKKEYLTIENIPTEIGQISLPLHGTLEYF